MKIYISADIEGVACIAAGSETDISCAESTPFREQMTAEVVAACGGAFEGGAKAIVVKDAHWTGRNLDPHRLSAPDGRSIELIRGWSGHPFSMVQGLDRSFGMVAFVGYHSAASRAGNPLAHTISGRLFSTVELNGICASEFYLFGLAAASVGVPVGFLSGDKGLCEEAKQLIDGITTVATLEGVGASVQSVVPTEAVRRIREGMRRALSSPLPKPLRLPNEFLLKVEFVKAHDAYARSFYPGAKLVSERAVALAAKNYFEILTFLKIASKMS